MTIISEDTMRQMYLKQGLKEIHADADTLITKEALDYIRDKKIRLFIDGKEATEEEDMNTNPCTHPHKFINASDGSFLDGKPEHMTHLYGNTLVLKNHPRIVFRGKLDSLEAAIIELQVKADMEKRTRLTEDLEELLIFTRQILACEVKGTDFPKINLLGLVGKQLREMSHDPKKFFGTGHLLPSYKMGALCAGLNRLRTLAREAELAGVNAFCDEYKAEREDLLLGLNRLSSALYIMTLRFTTGYYQ